MNQLKISLRAADDPRTIKEENGVPTFASVFSLHNSLRKGREETVPITVKASHELALTLVKELKKGVAFVVEGQLAYYKSPETNRESYSIWADSFTDITPPKIHRAEGQPNLMSKSTTVTVCLDEEAYGVFQAASEIVSKAGIRVPTGQLVQTMINAEMSRLSAREIAQRFLKSIMKQVGVLSGQNPDDDEDDTIPSISASKTE
jgi:hypothetical protein